jgi:SAM-dependent methyltransferase
MRLLNVGCGSRFHPAWVNIDFVSYSPQVRTFDLRKGLPFSDASFDAVYHSHLLEHLRRNEATSFLSDCFRVLRPNGTIRVVVPDLERIAREYISALETTEAGLSEGSENHEWMVIELIDQIGRDFPGGEMGQHLKRSALTNRDFIIRRIGEEGERLLDESFCSKRRPLMQRLRGESPANLFKIGRRLAAKRIAGLIAGKEATTAISEGLFRNSGEIHRWMYDHLSLHRILKNSGFSELTSFGATTSRIPGFAAYCLDTDAKGKVRKPDSLFMEGTRPIG